METPTVTKQQNTEVLASDILLAILVNLKRKSGKKQLFMKINYSDFHLMFWLPTVFDELIARHFVYSHSGHIPPFSPSLQEAIEQLQAAGMICWPDIQEPNLMRLNPSAESYYEKLLVDGDKKLPLQDIISIRKIANMFMAGIKSMSLEAIVDRPHLMNC